MRTIVPPSFCSPLFNSAFFEGTMNAPKVKYSGSIVLQADKDGYRGLLAGLEDVTCKNAVDADAEAAKK